MPSSPSRSESRGLAHLHNIAAGRIKGKITQSVDPFRRDVPLCFFTPYYTETTELVEWR
ncbi:predicted protein [Botrytis cinerea T4]|uniref:Uncharacterized protein n=1 Tax=Botryotinia fuckeliana (strain T4) TaxID=999810 RepID=G2YXN6_BOTF4|nr:predicted protein [Botrytis cinerea T4]